MANDASSSSTSLPALVTPRDRLPSPADSTDSALTALSRTSDRKTNGHSDSKEEDGEKGVYCHQCRKKCDTQEVLRCTKLKHVSKHKPPRPCNMAYCDRDLIKWYDVKPSDVRQQDPFEFICPCCKDECKASPCRKKKGLDPVGAVKPKESPSKPDSAPTRKEKKAKNGPAKVDKLKKEGTKSTSKVKRPTGPSTFDMDDGSSLSAIESDEERPKKKAKLDKAGATKPRKSSTNGKVTTPIKKTSASTKSKAKGAQDEEGKTKKSSKSAKSNGTTTAPSTPKGKAKAAAKPKAKTTPKPKATPKLKPIPVVPPPDFERVDTRLSRTEVEQRIALREFLCRFRSALMIPERSLIPLDDFDRPLTEASAKLFAGSIMDAIKEELYDEDVELSDTISQLREELRYYADMARFASIYQTLKSSLGLRVPRGFASDGVVSEFKRAASRIPQPTEVVEMLLALSERALITPRIKTDLDSKTEETEIHKVHAVNVKKENTEYEAEKKKLSEARVRSKSAAATKTAQSALNFAEHQHGMRMAALGVGLQSALSRRAARYEELGRDADGRVYHALTPRPVEEDGRPPIGWASGLLIYNPEDNCWSHFGKSVQVKELISWLVYTSTVMWRELPKQPPLVKSNLFKISTPKRSGSNLLSSQRKRQRSNSSVSSMSSAPSSRLSTPPTDEEIPEVAQAYLAQPQVKIDQIHHLIGKLSIVLEWLQVLEWKGQGEVR